jgi:hypothetical protein
MGSGPRPGDPTQPALSRRRLDVAVCAKASPLNSNGSLVNLQEHRQSSLAFNAFDVEAF